MNEDNHLRSQHILICILTIDKTKYAQAKLVSVEIEIDVHTSVDNTCFCVCNGLADRGGKFHVTW